MNKAFLFLAAMALWTLATAFSQPADDLRQVGSEQPILVSSRADKRVLSIFERSCQNCHSSNVKWPIYGKLFPASLLIARDVQDAKSHMDLSRWQTYQDSEKARILSEIGSVVRNGIMPPRRYTLLHPEAKLGDSEVNEIYQWTRLNRKLLGHQAAN